MPVSVALLQVDVSSEQSPEIREAHVLSMIADASAGAELLVLPELWHVGAHDLEAARIHAQSIDGPLVGQLTSAARAHGIWLHAGSFAELDECGTRFNTSLLINPRGELVARYRKIHLFGFDSGEAALMSAGEDLVQAQTPLGITGLATCYDLRFPELFRASVAAGCEALLIASGWPASRIEHWSVLLRARAIENQCWVLACNEVGTQGSGDEQVELGGRSAVINPMGEVIAEGGTGECIVFASVDPATVAGWRSAFPVLRDIRLSSGFTA